MDAQMRMLDEAEAHFNAGQFIKGADLVWQAAYGAVTNAAARAGHPCRNKTDAFRFAKTLRPPEHLPELKHWHRINLSAAEAYIKQANQVEPDSYWPWEPREYIETLDSIREMVEHLNALPG